MNDAPVPQSIVLTEFDTKLLIELFNNGRFAEVESRARELSQVYPHSGFVRKALGTSLLRQGKNALALFELQKASELMRNDAEVHRSVANALYHLGRRDEAVASYRLSLQFESNNYQVHFDLGVILNELGRLEESVASYRSAVTFRNEYAEAHNNLGTVLRDMGQLVDAVKSCQRAIAIKPDFVNALGNLANTLRDLGRLDEAEVNFRRALEINPDFAGAGYNLSLLLLSQGRYAEGWQQYEYRWDSGYLGSRRIFAQPLWLGEIDLAGKSILLHSEQGFGDALQFIRYATLLADRGAIVHLEVPSSLKSLSASCRGIAGVFSPRETLPSFDYHCPLMSLPLACKTDLETIPSASPYLSASREKIDFWQNKLGKKNGLRVGLTWAGGTRKHLGWMDPVRVADRLRSIGFDQLKPLLEVPCVEFYSLQLQDETASNFNDRARLIDHTPELLNFEDSAALIQNLDLVICVDTSVAHLTGAIGKPVWLLNRYNSCWRWQMERTDSPWYPSMRIFRQSTLGDWAGVIENVKLELARIAAPADLLAQ